MKPLPIPMKERALEELCRGFDFEFFKTLGEPVRLDILSCIFREGRSDVGSIAEHLPQDRSVISRHLTIMHQAGILRAEKEGRHMFYEIDGKNFLGKLETFVERVRRCTKECCP